MPELLGDQRRLAAGIQPTTDPAAPTKRPTRRSRVQGGFTTFIPQAKCYPRLGLGVVLVAIVAALAIFAPLFAPFDPTMPGLASPRSSPSSTHWLGLDALGRDNFSRLIYGSRSSIIVALAVVALNVAIGTVVGLCAGYLGSWIDMVLMRATDLVLAFPLFLVAVAIVGSLSASLTNVVMVLGLLGWTAIARLVRSSVLAIRHVEYVDAARSIGASNFRILFYHILPNVLGSIIVAATFGVASAVLLEASLSFLGLGVQPPTPSWGNMLADAQSLSTLQSMPYLWAPPGVAIIVLVSAMNLVGNGLQDLLLPDG